VVGRELTFSDPEIIGLVRREFIAVAGDDWYERRKDDAEGKFFRSVADQGPRKGQGGSTRQGIYVLTAGGKLLAYRNAQDPKVMRQVMKQGLATWNKLPAEQRQPGAVDVGVAGATDQRFDRRPPPGTLIVNVFTRILDRDSDGNCKPGTCSFPGGDRAARDHFWLLEEEWRSLIPKDARKGQTFDLPQRLLQRIVRFHLIDNTRGEPPMWERRQVRAATLKLVVDEANAQEMLLRLEGKGLLATDADTDRADRGFDFAVLGYIHWNAAQQKIERFDVVVLGDHWGAGRFTGGARPGRAPLGIAFTLARGDAADQVPPQAARSLSIYLRAEKD
jgi:hypothetical protein